MSQTNHFVDSDLREPHKARAAIFELETLALAVSRAIDALQAVDRIVGVVPRYLFIRRFTGASAECLRYVLRLILEELTTRRRWVPAAPESTSAAIASAWAEDLLTNQSRRPFGVQLVRNNESSQGYGPAAASPLAELERIIEARTKRPRAEPTETRIDVDSFGIGGGGPYGGIL